MLTWFWPARSAGALFRMRSKKRIGDRPTRHGTPKGYVWNRSEVLQTLASESTISDEETRLWWSFTDWKSDYLLFLTQKCESGTHSHFRNQLFQPNKRASGAHFFFEKEMTIFINIAPHPDPGHYAAHFLFENRPMSDFQIRNGEVSKFGKGSSPSWNMHAPGRPAGPAEVRA